MPRIEAVFLDLGNVLVFHDDPVLFQRMSAWGGSPPDLIRQRMLELWDAINRGELAGDALRQTVCQVAGSEVPLSPDAFRKLWNCHFRVNEALLPTVDELLSQVKVLLLSNTNALHLDYLRPQVPLLSRFTDLVLSYEHGLAKPDPAFFAEALRRAKVPAEATAFFDDVSAFADAAQAVGIHGHVFRDVDQFQRQLRELGLRVE